MIPQTPSIYVTFVLYLLLMLVVGLLAWRRTRNLSDYILAGRGLGPWITALSAGASDMSGWLLLGLPGYAYAAGYEAIWIAGSLLIGTWLNWRLVAGRLRRFTQVARDAQTIPDFLQQRFVDPALVLRIVSGLFILFFFTFYTASGLVAGGKLFNAVFNLPYAWAVTAGALTIIAYTFLGGFFAVSWTDAIQATLMFFALIAVPLTALVAVGGWEAMENAIRVKNAALLDPMTNAHGRPLTFLAILSLVGWGLGYFGQPHILVRFMAIRDSRKMPSARRIAMSWVTGTMTGAVLVGLAGAGSLPMPLAGADSEKVFIVLVGTLFHPVLAGVWLAAILAAIMSTADSQLLVASSALTHDLYKTVFRRDAGPREFLWVGRIGVIAVAAVALLLAMNPDSRVLDLVAYAWAGFGAAFGPTLLFALFWKRMTRNGALAGIMGGGLTVIVWKQVSGGIFDLYEIIPGFIFSSLLIVAVSLLDRKPVDPEVIEQFEAAQYAE